MNHHRSFSEKELMNDLIASEKQISSSYNIGITEASCSNLRQHLTNCLNNSHQIQYDIFDAMRQRGWYQVKKANSQDVESAKTRYNQEKTQLQ
ncbi:spore coat protein [Alkaliphilus pronyensis]|uniref:Spore coat protein n=1 Tax=Alkaliphilus pronyensis TaxID=1482732 RepID=A0A6I0FAN3_9FIRM|nr:spore coat protein [Alkaliphilus pronyensis]KAB3534402.1 spore coat protein [Alkaliphilus pronyensis]